MDIYPTLIELCGLPKMELEARNISPLLKNPKLEWNYPAITTYGRNNHSIRTEKWHYIRYNDNSEELYDHNKDPYEWKNLASDPKYTETIKNIAVWLPKINATAVPPDSTILRRQRQMMRDTTAIKN
jgi:arylsulfatase A-like enzyme